MKKGILSWSIVAFLAACGGSETGPGGGGTSLKTANAFCQAWGEAACNDNVVDACGGDDVDACVASQQSFCLDVLPIGYDPKYAPECISAIEAAYADADLSTEELGVVLQLDEPCDRLIKGFDEAGDVCSEDTDCNTLEDLQCVIKAGETDGTCQVPVDVGGGDPCDGAAQVCASGYYCDGENCIRHKQLAGACTHDDQCSTTTRCDAAVGETGECVARLEDGETCTADTECQSHLCAIPRGATEGVCVSEIRLSAGIALCEDLR